MKLFCFQRSVACGFITGECARGRVKMDNGYQLSSFVSNILMSTLCQTLFFLI